MTPSQSDSDTIIVYGNVRQPPTTFERRRTIDGTVHNYVTILYSFSQRTVFISGTMSEDLTVQNGISKDESYCKSHDKSICITLTRLICFPSDNFTYFAVI